MGTRSKAAFSEIAVSSGPTTEVNVWIGVLRLHHWSKNVLVFIPLLMNHQFQQWRVLASLQAFFVFSLCASGFYVLNDLLDMHADRAHPRKARRPFASGDLSVRQGFVLLAACLATVAALAWKFPPSARMLLLLYALINLAYSVRLKQIVFLDVLVLALLYMFRVLFGGAAAHIDVSFWTLAFFGFLFLGLALIKRWTELLSTIERNGDRLPRRGYLSSHIGAVRSLAQASLYVSVLVLALYINSLTALKGYRHPQVLWMVCPLLFAWIRRVTLITNRGSMADDPVLFAVKDPGSQVTALLVTVFVAFAAGF